MLHSSLPRAFLAPGFNYLGYYGDEVHQRHPHHHHPPAAYGATTSWHIPMESASAYSRVPEHRVLHTWDLSRSSTPCPLDLSLKPPPTPSTPSTPSAPSTPSTPKIEEDCPARPDARKDRDKEVLDERRIGGEAIGYRGRGTDDETGSVIVDDDDDYEAGPSGRSGYEQLPSKQEPDRVRETPEKTCLPDEATRLAVPFGTVTDIASKYYDHKLLLASPSQLQSVQQSCYHHQQQQQLLLTPQHPLQGMQGMQHAPMTPPSTPSPPQCPRRKAREEEGSPASTGINAGTRSASTDNKLVQRPKKKHARRLKFDEDTSSPVSGTVILGPDEAVVTGDIDPAFNIVEVTEEARAELAKIENRLGPYQCKLCRQLHEDAFQLAQHRCSRIAHVEYRCPECDKRFSCPANLASHRRWHKPRLASGEPAATAATIEIPCTRCDAKFTRQAALRKHLASQHPEASNNGHAVLDGQAATVGGKVDVVQALSDGSSSTEMP